MRGGIQKKGNRYYAVVYDGVDPGTGKKRRTWIPAGTRRSDAEKILAEEIKRRHDGEPIPTEKLTFGQYLTDRWLPIQKSRVRHSTYDSYRRNIDLHVLPALGGRPIERLTPDDIDVFYATLLTEGRKKPMGSKAKGKRSTAKTPKGDGEVDDKPVGLAPKTVRNIHLMLNKAMNDAQRKGIVIRNVVSLADAPTLRNRQEGNIKAWDVKQLRTFLDSVRDHRLHPAFHLSSHTGMRRGEVLGLRWCDVDLDAGRAAVGRTKNGSQFVLALLPEVVTELRRFAPRQPNDELVFCGRSPFKPMNFSKAYSNALARAGIEGACFHSLRHTHASWLAQSGAELLQIAESLNHKSLAMTKRYSHLCVASREKMLSQVFG